MRIPLVRSFRQISVWTALVAAIGAFGPRSRGQETATGTDERTERLEEMALIAHSIKIFAVNDQGRETAAVSSDEPLQRWTDPTREFSDGGMWVWRAGGRPVAVAGIELYSYWSIEFVSLSPGLVRGAYSSSGVQWKPAKAGAEFRVIPNAPEPGNTESLRLRQMRELAQRFSAMERWADKGQFALRLLPHPIDRYATPASGTLDGGLFVLAHGTNPEVLLLIEARKRGEGPARWEFAAMHLSHAEIILKVGGKEVLTLPNKDAGRRIVPSDPYYDVLVPRRLAEVRNRERKGKARP
jgi:hypothetical protein